MSTLNLFPARVPIGKVRLPDNPDGTEGDELDAFASMEFLKALKVLFDRVGGANGMSNEDLATLAMLALSSGNAPISAGSDAGNAAFQTPDQSAEIAQLRHEMEDLRALVSSVSTAAAGVAEMQEQAIVGGYQDQFRLDLTRPGPIGMGIASSGAFTTLSATGQITSTLATGTAPLVVASTTKVSNLNADLLDGTDWTAPGPIGATTPSTGKFTTVDATNSVGAAASVAYRLFDASGNYSFGMGPTNTEGFINYNSGTASNASFGHRWNINSVEVAKVDGTGLFTVASLKSVAGFGCNGKAAQTAVASGGALNAYGAGANGLDTGANMSALHAMVVAIRAALVADGIMS